ncbi:MAG: hypothetical protein EXS19_05840, partial [Pedosphaera sp.]|nr:hypothetical protein [Pedosphaera sp.]
MFGEPFRALVARHLRHFVMDAFQPGPRVALAALREDAVPAGALAYAAPFRAAVPSSGDALLKTVLFAQREIGSGSQARDAIVTKKATRRPLRNWTQ